MPTYEYECRKCGLHFEKFQSMKAKPVRTCPDCGGAVRRLIGAGAAIISRGSRSAGGGSQRPETRCPLGRPTCDRDTPCRLRDHED